MRKKIRAKSLYQLFEVIQFLKLLNPIVRGQFSLVGQTLQVIALGQKDTSPVEAEVKQGEGGGPQVEVEVEVKVKVKVEVEVEVEVDSRRWRTQVEVDSRRWRWSDSIPSRLQISRLSTLAF